LLNFLEPIWLWASTAMIIPVIIHLWHVREGRRLKIGSVAFLEASTKQRSNNRIPRDLMLLLLRCLMILLITFMLARPVLSSGAEKTAKGWVLLDRNTMKSAVQQYASAIDSFKKAGMEFHYFEPGFPPADLSKPIDSITHSPTRYLALASMLEEENSADSYKVFVPFYSSGFHGKTNGLNKVSWYPVETSDSVRNWIADAWQVGNDSIRIIKGMSTAAKVDYAVQVISSDNTDPEFEIINNNAVKIRNQQTHEVTIGRKSLAVTIVSERNAPDSRYLRSALEAIASYTGKEFIITEAEPGGFKEAGCDWLFWLSERTLPPNKAINIFHYRAGNASGIHSWITDRNVSAAEVSLLRSIADSSTSEKVWTDGMGSAVLSRDQQNNQVAYHFSTRFLPAWSGLPWSEHFPGMLMRLMLNENDNALRLNDRRMIDPEILSADSSLPARTTSKIPTTMKDSSFNVWIALLLCFLIERMLSWYYQKTTAHGG
jgi:hypothetical protein